jgi:fumarate hydratase class I
MTKQNFQFRRIDTDGITKIEVNRSQFIRIEPGVLVQMAKEAFYELSFFLAPEHLDELAKVAQDETASKNERFVCRSLIKNAIISSQGKLPLCQDTGTATVFAWRGEKIITQSDDKNLLEKGIAETWAENYLRNSQIAATEMFVERNTGTNLPAQIEIEYSPADEYRFLFIAKGGGSSNKTILFQASKSLLNEQALYEFLSEKIKSIGVAACPPYTIGVVIGGTSPENNLKTLKLATAGWYDELEQNGNNINAPFRDKKWEEKVLNIAATTGWGAQFGGKHMALNAKVIRLPRHAGSCPVSIGVSCSAHRNMIGKINEHGAFLQVLDHNPARLAKICCSGDNKSSKINLDKPMKQILEQLNKFSAGDMVLLNGKMTVARDMVHAEIFSMASKGQKIPDYFKQHPVYYAGPAKTPPGHAIGSFGPTTAQRMDKYVDFFMSRGSSMVMIAKGNRSAEVVDACKKYGGFYLGTIGGAAALIAREHVVSARIIDFAEFGMEAVYEIVVKDFPAFIVYDNNGRSIY